MTGAAASNAFAITAPKPIDGRMGKFVSGQTVPFASKAEAFADTVAGRRSIGVEVMIGAFTTPTDFSYYVYARASTYPSGGDSGDGWDLINKNSIAPNVTPNAMAALAIDVTKQDNTKSISADSTFTFSATPAVANTYFGLHLTNTDGSNARVITIPSSFSMSQQAAITSFEIPAGGRAHLLWRYTGSGYELYGETRPYASKGFGLTFPTGDDDTVVIMQYMPHGGKLLSATTKSDSGTATYEFSINGTPVTATPNAVSSTEVTQTITAANTFVAGDTISVERSSDATCINGRFSLLYRPDAP